MTWTSNNSSDCNAQKDVISCFGDVVQVKIDFRICSVNDISKVYEQEFYKIWNHTFPLSSQVNIFIGNC